MSITLQKNKTDCMPTCLSELLNIPYEDIPVFIDLENVKDGDGYDNRIKAWLDSIGYFRIVIPVKYELKTNSVLLPYCSLKEYRCIGILNQKNKVFSHAVLLNIDINTDQILVDDPLGKGTTYSLKDIIEIEFIVKKGL